ncbi:MAG: DUF3160 domain-containing protein [Clostridiaceae bacterium]|nr:DUF3160 domain-containing protein [Clostridiaceae bacterium]
MTVKRVFAAVMVAVQMMVCAVTLTACTLSVELPEKNEGKQAEDLPDDKQTTGDAEHSGDKAGTDGDKAGADGDKDTGAVPVGIFPKFAAERERKYIDVEWKPVSYEKNVAPYKVNKDLSNVENAGQFGRFSDRQLELLSENGFVVIPSEQEQLFYIYERNEYLRLPSLITTDSVLQTYHIFFDYSLRTVELNYLLEHLEQLTDSMLKKSIGLYGSISNPEVKAAALKNIAYFAAAQIALEKELPKDIPNEALELARAEYSLITAADNFVPSPIFGFKLDYSQYKPRGHYTRNHSFERFFKAMMWYGQAPFPLLDDKGQLVVSETLQAMLITCCIFTEGSGTPDAELWENIYDPTVFYVGSADDLTIYHYKDMIVKVYGSSPDPETFTDSTKLKLLLEETKKLPQPKIQADWVEELNGVDTPVGQQFRFMGQRYIPDSEILQKLCEAIIRPFPKGLDVMGVLGSDRAYEILTKTYDEDKKWPEYPKKFNDMREKFTALPDQTWRSNIYYGWLWVLKGFLAPFEKGYPSFMTGEAWQDKSLNTALASWSELRHDTILYGKQSGAEMGGGEEIPFVRGYVEPNIEVYSRLLWLTRYSRENLHAREMLSEDMKLSMERFEKLLQFLIDCSVKELRNEELTREEYDRILFYGGELERLTSSCTDEGVRWFEITSETDKNMAVIADVHTTPGYYLEEGVGTASEIFAVVPIGGKLYLTRGAVFSYYEFVSDTRLTDEEWQKALKEKKQPPLPVWTESFTDVDGVKAEIPMPVDTFD